MPDIHKMAMLLSLLERGASIEVASLLADAVHPFAEMGRWTSDRRSEKAVRKIAQEVASSTMRSDSQRWEKTKWAFTQYAAIAPQGSQAKQIFTQALQRDPINHPRKVKIGNQTEGTP